MEDNKNSFFMFELIIKETQGFKQYSGKEAIERAENRIEPVLNKIGATDDTFTITDERNPGNIIFMVRTSQRKRLSLVRNSLKKYIKGFNEEEFNNLGNEKDRAQYTYDKINVPQVGDVTSLTKKGFNEELARFRTGQNFKIKCETSIENNYKGKDVDLFGNIKNWFPWQKKLYKLIYGKNNCLLDSDDRSIILIVDEEGNSGKSKFAKFLYLKNKDQIMLISEGSANQLRSAVVNAGANKKLYIVDIPRTTNSESTDALLNVLESLKNGLLSSHMYGRSDNSIIINPPTIIVFSNRYLSANLSVDRWDSYSILKNNDWKNITKDVIKKATRSIDIQKKIDAMEVELLDYKYKKMKEKVNHLKKSPEASFG